MLIVGFGFLKLLHSPFPGMSECSNIQIRDRLLAISLLVFTDSTQFRVVFMRPIETFYMLRAIFGKKTHEAVQFVSD